MLFKALTLLVNILVCLSEQHTDLLIVIGLCLQYAQDKFLISQQLGKVPLSVRLHMHELSFGSPQS